MSLTNWAQVANHDSLAGFHERCYRYHLNVATSSRKFGNVFDATMSIGFGVGDLIAVYQLASKIRKEFADAPSQFKDISDEFVTPEENPFTLMV
jgi:hypothetical protein